MLLVFTNVSTFTIVAAINKSNTFGQKLPPTSLMWIGMGSLIFDGSITENAYENLDASLNTELGHNVTSLAINSPDGDENAAEKIVILLNKRGIEISILPKRSCGLACVPLFLHTHKHTSLDDGQVIPPFLVGGLPTVQIEAAGNIIFLKNDRSRIFSDLDKLFELPETSYEVVKFLSQTGTIQFSLSHVLVVHQPIF
ncbi:hypothetical protein FKW31_13640 [Acetobacter sp. DmW_136]|uniref:hypothetical protein n=1 Tax=Acetobacter sp. DmW_136 TaxID=2591091 RepID=UPI00123BD35F|nr:hypothetical protein [Acetobacter sp. DmW_136]KAA8383957.1 hypothetical protein FKW31_13640 [Acetobacter sp. DmW_136]